MQDISRRGFIGLALSGAACLTGGLAGCTGATPAGSGSSAQATVSASSDTLRVGVRADIVGFGYLNDQTGKYYGLEIDIANDLAKRLGYKSVSFSTVTPENRKDMLLDGDIDALIACYSIAETRLENFDFSPAYYDDAIVAVVENSSLIESIDDLRGCTFGCMGGANAAPLLNNKLKEIGFSTGTDKILGADDVDVKFDTWRLVQFPSYQELSDALEEGAVDAMVLDGAIAKTYMNDERSILDGFNVDEVSYGVATVKGSELSARVASAVQDMLDDGTIDALVDKWD